MDIIKANNIKYDIDNKNIFHNLNLSIKEGEFITIIGRNGVGKSTLLKLLSGQIITNNDIFIDNIRVDKFSIDEINKRTAKITSYNEFFSKTVMEEILQDKRNYTVFDTNKVKKMLDSFNLLYLEKLSVQNLSYAENQIVALIKSLNKNPKVLVMDNAFSKLDIDKRKELYNYIKEYAKNNMITIINTTNDMSDLKYSNRIVLLKNGNISFDGTYEELIEKIDLNKEGLKYPFEVEFSNKLMMYDLINKRFNSIDELVGELCK